MNVLRSRVPVQGTRTFCTCTPSLAPRSTSTKPTLSGDSPVKRSHTKRPPIKNLPQTELFTSLQKVTPISRRPTLINEDSARELVRAWGVDKMHDVTVVEPYAGPGGLTRAFLELKNVKKVIVVEEARRYQDALLAAKANLDDPERLSIVQHDPFLWEAYAQMEEDGHMKDVPRRPWEEVHQNLFLAAQLPNSQHGQQLFLQFVAAAANRNQMWLWQYGRFQMGFLGPDALWQKLLAQPGTPSHHKMAVLIPAIGDLQGLPLLSGLSPPDLHFHRPRGDPAQFSAVKFTPKVEGTCKNYEALEYCARHMFVAKSHGWGKAVGTLAAGSGNLIPEMLKRGMPDESVKVNELEPHHWAIVADVFDEWPFRPTMLFDEGQFTSLD